MFYATLAVAALAMAGCEKSNDMPQESGPGHPAEIRFAPAIVPLTRATGTAFEEGDAVGIYCVESTDDPAAAIVGERSPEPRPVSGRRSIRDPPTSTPTSPITKRG